MGECAGSCPDQHVNIGVSHVPFVVAAVRIGSDPDNFVRGARGDQIEEAVAVEVPDESGQGLLWQRPLRRQGNGLSRLEGAIPVTNQHVQCVIAAGDQIRLAIAVKVTRDEGRS
jgi:hypothetical protein